MAYEKSFDDSAWQDVTIPHDWAIEGPWIVDGDGNTGKLPWKGEGWYRNRFTVPASDAGKTVYLLFDGIMAFPQVYVNGSFAGRWDYGYNSFWLDITGLVDFRKENVLAIHADTRQHDSRWYPGGGIYRKIRMIVVNPVHVAMWGVYITTPEVGPDVADVRISATINNHSETGEQIRISHTILDNNGKRVQDRDLTGHLPAGASSVFESVIQVEDPVLWDVENPALYTLVTEIFRDHELLDSDKTLFGIRTIYFTADDGFYLNNRRIQLKGVNLHHDLGALGAAFNERAMERQLEIMKEMGCNAIRSSHNPPAPEVLDVCDRIGLLVFDEVFDKFDAKADIADTTDFAEFARRNIRNFLLRDRNHPSVFIWSVGNEIGDVQNSRDNGFMKLKTMVDLVREYDPTRPVTLVCDDRNSASLRHFEYYDVHSWNYGRRYSLARELEPGKAVIISESASTLSTRGFYELPLPALKTDFTNSLQRKLFLIL
jgi:beta-galactosidase